MKRVLQIGGLALLALAGGPSRADVGPPAHLRSTEREPGLFSAQWRVPKALPPRAVPVPQFPESCRPVGQRVVLEQAGAWLFTRDWRCESSLAGEIVGMSYPFPNLALTTVARVDLLSGDRFANVLTPGDAPWRLPEGTAAPDLVRAARRAVLSGVSHVAGSWIHSVFLVTVALLGGIKRPIRLVSVFTLGQIAGVFAATWTGGLDAVPARFGFAVAVALLAREALRPAEERRRLAVLVAAAGLVHGLGIAALLSGGVGDEMTSVVGQLLAVLGMDATHLVGAACIAALWTGLTRPLVALRVRNALAYGAGVSAMALAISLAVGGDLAESGTAIPGLAPPMQSAAGSAGATAGSRRVAPSVSDATVQSFLAVEPFEVRHEVMLRLEGLAVGLGLDPADTLDIDAQPALTERLAELVLDHAQVQVDGASSPGLVRRADFMTVDSTGALPRTFALPESVGEAIVGVVVAYPTDGIPEALSLIWDDFPTAGGSIPATVIDPESLRSVTLTAEEPTLTWENALVEDPVPTVEAVEVEPTRLPVPLLSLPLLALSAGLLIVGLRRRTARGCVAAARVLMAAAFIVGPVGQTAVALPGSAGRAPSERQARRILAGLLPNIYRAMEFRDEALIYDRLEVSVTGETLIDVYLEQRRALAMEERGGAQARVEAVEVLEARDIEAHDRGFGVRSIWTVGGMVTHFGHRHFRQNRDDARIEVVPGAGTWKIHSLEVLEQDRVR